MFNIKITIQMQNNKNERTVLVAINGNCSKGDYVEKINGLARITTSFDGRRPLTENIDSLTFNGDGGDCPKLEAGYSSESRGGGETSSSLEIDLAANTYDPASQELHEVISAGAKITKADAGRSLGKVEEHFRLKVEKDCDTDSAKTNAFYQSKYASPDELSTV